MNEYGVLAGSYDQLTADVDYPAWADYLERQFARAKRPVHTVLDLACGTGSLTLLLAQRGYEMIGVDFSPEMLAQAKEKWEQRPEGIAPLFLCQRMERLDLYGTVDACICCLDSVNHVLEPARLRRAFERVRLFLAPGGLFLFDINTPDHLRAMDGQLFLDETDGAYCVWRADYHARRRVCTFAMDLFRREGGHWLRGQEVHEEYAYEPETLVSMLKAAGFKAIRQYGNLKLRPPKVGEARIFFAARKE